MKRQDFMLSQKGFTLVEMMIVVAIIGILTTLAKFGYENYQESARQSEAKLTLPAIATSLEQFRSEYGGYISDMNALRFVRKGSSFWYAVGWRGDVPCGDLNNGYYGAVGPTTYNFGATVAKFDGTACNTLVDSPRTSLKTDNCRPTGGVGGTTTTLSYLDRPDGSNPTTPASMTIGPSFLVAVSGLISGGKRCDVWTIDDAGKVVQVHNGK